MVATKTMTSSQSHGGALYYVVEVPQDKYYLSRHNSTESGWDNPFRPGGDLSREADEIVNLIKGGKPITPTGDPNLTILNGDVQIITENGTSVVDGAIKSEVSQLQSTPQNGTNGTKSPQKPTIDKASTNGDTKSQPQISNQVLPTPQSASHVILEDKKKKKSCCVIQ